MNAKFGAVLNIRSSFRIGIWSTPVKSKSTDGVQRRKEPTITLGNKATRKTSIKTKWCTESCTQIWANSYYVFSIPISIYPVLFCTSLAFRLQTSSGAHFDLIITSHANEFREMYRHWCFTISIIISLPSSHASRLPVQPSQVASFQICAVTTYSWM